MSVGKRTRFEVFKRDKFTCQYCGARAPDVVLHADHITPRAAGGSDDILNLVTACASCNGGKSDVLLSSHAEMDARGNRMRELEERRQQLEMLRDWHVSLASLDRQTAEMLFDVWRSLTCTVVEFSESSCASLVQMLKKYSFNEVVAGMKMACEKHLAPGTTLQPNSGEVAFKCVAKYCRIAKINAENPADGRKRYVLGILRNRLPYVNLSTAAKLIDGADQVGVSFDYMEDCAKQSVSWTQFRDTVLDACDVVAGDSEGQSNPYDEYVE